MIRINTDTPRPFNIGEGTGIIEGTTKVFLYGNLKHDGFFNQVHEEHSSKLLNSNTIIGGYALVNLDSFPGLIEVDNSNSKVAGELWEIPLEMLIDLDFIEGVAHGLYARVWEDSVGAYVYVYLANQSVPKVFSYSRIKEHYTNTMYNSTQLKLDLQTTTWRWENDSSIDRKIIN